MEQQEKLVIPSEIEKMPEAEANKIRVLVLEDRAKYAFEIETHMTAVAQLKAAIAKCDLIVADLDRKVAGVDYPSNSETGKPENNTDGK